MNDQDYDYPSQVSDQIPEANEMAYASAAHSLNRRGYDVLSVQHEYGIFGGVAGSYLLHLVRAAHMPVITTLHTVLRHPSPDQRAVLEELMQLSARVVVMSRTAIQLLSEVHGVDLSKVDYIPHGIPEISPGVGLELRREIGGKGPILLTFGLLSPDKGIEDVIKALPSLTAVHPEAKYLVVGATHPHIKVKAGEAYRESLTDLARKLGVSDNVEFIDEFVDLDKLVQFLSATDFYITPYLNPMQITSGTLAYSLGAGKVVISTPYEYAKEVLAGGRGILVPFREPEAIANEIIACCANQPKRDEMGACAKTYGSRMFWSRVGSLYMDCFDRAIEEATCIFRPLQELDVQCAFPSMQFSHLEVLTDDTGILQHATYSVPNRSEGYCVDDNARSLLLTVLLEEKNESYQRLPYLQARYLSFVVDAFNETSGRFRNFMSFRREWLEDSGSEDSQGRSLWTLGTVAGRSRHAGHALLAAEVFLKAAPALAESRSPRTWAYLTLGAAAFLERYPDSAIARSVLEDTASKLGRQYEMGAHLTWPWPEERLAYANARIPQAMMVAGKVLENPDLTSIGVESLTWLMDRQVGPNGCFSPVGAVGAGRHDFGTVQFAQQPVEVWSSVSACLTAASVTGLAKFEDLATWCFAWFGGGNVLGIPVANPDTGGCYDGLEESELNLNQGAESTLSYLCALAELHLANERSLRESRLGVLR